MDLASVHLLIHQTWTQAAPYPSPAPPPQCQTARRKGMQSRSHAPEEFLEQTDRKAIQTLGIHGVGKTSWRDELKFTRQRGSRRAFCACTNVRRTGMWLSRRGRWERRSNGDGRGEASRRVSWELEAKLRGLGLVPWALESPAEVWWHVPMGAFGGDHHGSTERGLHGGAETWSQATAIVQAKEGEACTDGAKRS